MNLIVRTLPKNWNPSNPKSVERWFDKLGAFIESREEIKKKLIEEIRD